MKIALLTAGRDPHYALGLLESLVARGVSIDFVGNDAMQNAEVCRQPGVHYLNLRGDQTEEASTLRKILRVLRYYGRLVRYAVKTESSLFHILWYNKFEWLDNTLLITYYKLLRKRLVHTAHNVDTKGRDTRSTFLRHLHLKFMYRKMDHIFVHTGDMKDEIIGRFGVLAERVSVIPFGVNNIIPRSALTREGARRRLGIELAERVLLFFGNIAPYKGLDLLIEAFSHLDNCRLLIAGRIKNCPDYWKSIEEMIESRRLGGRIMKEITYVPDDEVEIFFKASDALVMPYRRIDQSGVIFLAYSFGVPVIATDVGSLRDSIRKGETGFVCPPDNPEELARTIESYFQSSLYKRLEEKRGHIIDYVNTTHSWDRTGEEVSKVYSELLCEKRLRKDTLKGQQEVATSGVSPIGEDGSKSA